VGTTVEVDFGLRYMDDPLASSAWVLRDEFVMMLVA
jgi:hypothetical protein